MSRCNWRYWTARNISSTMAVSATRWDSDLNGIYDHGG
jgi:hypothetical protein